MTAQRQPATAQQAHMVSWERRKAIDKTMALGAADKVSDGTVAKKGGFQAFGAVEAGRLLERGHVRPERRGLHSRASSRVAARRQVEVHKLFSSGGRAGKYKLHASAAVAAAARLALRAGGRPRRRRRSRRWCRASSCSRARSGSARRAAASHAAQLRLYGQPMRAGAKVMRTDDSVKAAAADGDGTYTLSWRSGAPAGTACRC